MPDFIRREQLLDEIHQGDGRVGSEAIFWTSKLTSSPGHRRLRRCSPCLSPAMCCEPIRSSP
jgi:hypothetical protein